MASKLIPPPSSPCRPPRRLPILSRPALSSNLPDPLSSSAIQFSREHITLHQYDENVVRELSIPPESSYLGNYWNPSRSNGSSIGYTTTETSSFSLNNPSQQHALTNQSPRLRTQQNLIARHGLPSTLPPPPRTTYTQPPVELNLEELDKFLTTHYRAMRQENSAAVATPTAPCAPLPSGEWRARRRHVHRRWSSSLTPRSAEIDPFDAFIDPDSYTDVELPPASASEGMQFDFSLWEISPEETPLDTPDDHFGSPTADHDVVDGLVGMPLFGAVIKNADDSLGRTAPGGAESLLELNDLVSDVCPPSVMMSKPLEPTFTPASTTLPTSTLPSLDDAPYRMEPTPVMGTMTLPPDTLRLRPTVVPAVFPPPPPLPSTPASRSTRPLPTGIRKNITVDKLVPLDAPTQPRMYVSESATSRKAIPAAFRKKRALSELLEDGDVQVEDEEAISEKRRKNTLAARKSRARKLETMTQLQDQVASLTSQRDYWQARAYAAEETLQRHGLACPSVNTTT